MGLKVYLVLLIVLHESNSYFYYYYDSSSSFINHNSDCDSNMMEELNNSISSGGSIAFREREQNNWLPVQGISMKRSSIGFFRFNTGKIPQKLLFRQQNSKVLIKILQVYLNKHIRNKSAKEIMNEVYHSKIEASGFCQKLNKTCSKTELKYRSFDGTCNNVNFPFWGAAETPFIRVVRSDYEDNIYKPRVSVSGRQLLSPRIISYTVFHSNVKEDRKLSMMASQMAQLIAHDTHQALPDNVEGGPIQCCTDEGTFLPDALTHSSCMPIAIPSDDPVYEKYNQECMNFIRSITVPSSDCIVGPAEQVNMVTSYLDLSLVYGSSEEIAYSLRSRKDGQLKESSPDEYRMLPLTNPKQCDNRKKNDDCYIAGDSRVNQNPHLVAMHVVFLREHNRLATKLKELNTKWSDEKLFQEARRILIAQYQHIVYKEYLPHFIGKKFIAKLFAESDVYGFTNKYHEGINPGSLNSMNSAFRCYHSTIPDKIRLHDDTCSATAQYPFSKYIARPVICKDNEDEILNSLTCNKMKEISDGFTREVTDKLFKSTANFGLDLLALDIQRARDHGIASYNNFREYAGLGKVTKFTDLEKDMGVEKVDKLRQIYDHVDDIDLIVGSQLEKHVEDTQFGPVILAILREQFHRYMVSDRFFYTNVNQEYPFTPKQLQEIKKSSMARILCDNANIKIIQPKVFLKDSENNVRGLCSSIPHINLAAWKA